MEKKEELKLKKKAYKAAKRKYTTLWKTLMIIGLIFALILTPVGVVLDIFDNTISILAKQNFWELENEDETAIYFTPDDETKEALTERGREICKQVEAEGIQVNGTLWNFYNEGAGAEYRRTAAAMFSDSVTTIGEVPWNVYTDEVIDSVSEYGDAAIVVLSRIGGEGNDLDFESYNYLELDQNEKDMLSAISKMKSEGKVKKIVVLINSANTLQLDFLKENTYNVDACLWIGDVGVSGVEAVAEILSGKVSPSGSLADTYCYNNYSAPAMINFKPSTYIGYDAETMNVQSSSYVVYQEGIYVGYKYYETRYEDMVMGTGNTANYQYHNDVAYPFGFGLSYTEFEFSNMSGSYNAETDQFVIKVTVTNTGDTYSGKKTVQVYSQSPYTEYDKANGVEKSSVALCGFAKTDVLAPGESQEVTVYIDKSDLTSYDAYGKGTYILDEGDYYLAVAENAHDAVNQMLATKGYTVENTDGRMDADGNASLAYKWNQPTFDATTYAVSLNGTKIENQFNDADLNLYDDCEATVTYLTRNDWTGTFPQEAPVLTLTDEMKEQLKTIVYESVESGVEMPTLEADNGLNLYDMIGKDFDDPDWELLLDQMSVEEMIALISDSFHWTMPVESVNAPGTRDENGPSGLTASLFGDGSYSTTAFTSEDVMAATFNLELMEEVGNIIGNDCLNSGVAFLYGTGANIHRTPYSGRNFEYYSEDGFLSGEICAAEVKAIEEKGVGVLIKHYALNDSETLRQGLGIWANEQSIREIYLKAYQKSIEEVGANGVMTSFTRVGTTWAGGDVGLVANVLRGEWGCEGMVISDNAEKAYMNGPDGVLAGSSTYDAMLWYVEEQLTEYKDDPVIVNAMREACHYNLYAIANSCAMNGIGENTTVKAVVPAIVWVPYTLAVVFVILFVVSTVFWYKGRKKVKATDAYKEYIELKKQK